MRNWQSDKAWADQFLPAITGVVQSIAGWIIQVVPASDEQDQHEATDYIVTVRSGQIGCRIRRPEVTYRDLTLRYSRPSGVKTECAKIEEGWLRWYLYAWAKWASPGQFADWIWVDVDRLRESGLIEAAPVQYNGDGTTFKSISATDMDRAGVLLSASEGIWGRVAL